MVPPRRLSAAWRRVGSHRRLIAIGSWIAIVVACSPLGAPAEPALTIRLETLNASGVSGTVAFTEVQGGRTRVAIVVDPAAYPDMPAHIHPGTCEDLTPQPRYPLENVRNGTSTTEIPATVADLLASPVAVNLHASVSDLTTYTACADIR
jgi:hypothetical protein